MSERGKMVCENDNERLHIQIEQNMPESGKMVYVNENEQWFFQIEQNMPESGKMVYVNENERIHGQIEENMPESGKMMWENENELSIIEMGINTLVESGKTINYGHDMFMIKIERLYLKGGWMVKKRSNHRLLYF